MTARTSKIWLILFVPTYIVYIYAWKYDLHAPHKGLYRLDVLIFQFWADCEQSFVYCFWLLIRRLSVLELPQSDQVENTERALWKICLTKPQTATKVRAGQEASCIGRWAHCRYIMVVQTPLLSSDMSSPSTNLETLSSASSYLVANGAAIDHVSARLHAEPSEGRVDKCWGSADELGHYGGWLEQSADVDAAALLWEGCGCIGHGAAEVTHHINETTRGQQWAAFVVLWPRLFHVLCPSISYASMREYSRCRGGGPQSCCQARWPCPDILIDS